MDDCFVRFVDIRLLFRSKEKSLAIGCGATGLASPCGLNPWIGWHASCSSLDTEVMRDSTVGMTRLLIVYHSKTGGSHQMAEAAANAARDEIDTVLKAADEAQPEDLLQAEGYIFCAPENLAAIAGIMKDFFDRCYYPVLGKIEGRPYAQMVCAGSDGENAARQTARIAKGWRLKEVQPPLIIRTRAQTPEEILAEKTIPEENLLRCRELGAAMGAGLAMGVF
jgi:flavodoxin